MAPLAASSFDHVLAGALAFGSFVLAWDRRFAAAGLLAGAAAVSDYPTALIGLTLAVYVALAGVRPLLRFAVGSASPLAILAAYDWAAFGSPFHLSYRYIANLYSSDQRAGFFGVHTPTAHGLHLTLVGDRGILLTMPVFLAALAGLVVLARRRRREAITCGVAFALLLLVNCGYFNPYGGISPGPRFLIPGLPFLALGLAPAFARWWRTTTVLAAVSLVAITTLTVTWANTQDMHYRDTVWGELWRFLQQRGSSRLVEILTKNVFVGGPVTRLHTAALVAVVSVAAFGIAVRDARRGTR